MMFTSENTWEGHWNGSFYRKGLHLADICAWHACVTVCKRITLTDQPALQISLCCWMWPWATRHRLTFILTQNCTVFPACVPFPLLEMERSTNGRWEHGQRSTREAEPSANARQPASSVPMPSLCPSCTISETVSEPLTPGEAHTVLWLCWGGGRAGHHCWSAFCIFPLLNIFSSSHPPCAVDMLKLYSQNALYPTMNAFADKSEMKIWLLVYGSHLIVLSWSALPNNFSAFKCH